jgi:hypothetical protein
MWIKILSQGNPADHALATIASIFDKPEAHRANAISSAEEKLTPSTPVEVDGYAKTGPGPIAALRFKWKVRRADNGEYFVDETIGENSAAITNGPMTKEAAVELVDDREREARTRFEELRAEMTERVSAVMARRRDRGM